jgi:galactitol-specific phosphotransferase system IIB component
MPSIQHVDTVKCYTCNGNHYYRACPKEINSSPILKKKIGTKMEHWFADNFVCPECNCNTLCVLDNNTPSLDIICCNHTCNKTFEVKSKCLSVKILPDDINLPHGTYFDCINRIDDGLNLIVIIYGISRKEKYIYIRKILYANNDLIKDKSKILIMKKTKSYNSIIIIKNKEDLEIIEIDATVTVIISFKKEFEKIEKKFG